ncbi:hypothetical protein [Hansschlegelia zhihuaiae]|uniref:Uncharacterized protein n=1 Tax=Hansschlegelia zhihuaiae TaxID=405005 RepID=A0A4Q0M8H3_9HYPH|nr:hypothetical protein [Hansschlegelia zhihuaiae]RXF69213.1 hypothetical protein EK403_18665 [Hansschlegelia zhihuaiae]
MSTRTTESTVAFEHPSSLRALDGPQPPETYRVMIDEEEILGVSFRAYRRTATLLQTPAVSVRGGLSQSHLVDRADLEAALEADGKASRAS